MKMVLDLEWAPLGHLLQIAKMLHIDLSSNHSYAFPDKWHALLVTEDVCYLNSNMVITRNSAQRVYSYSWPFFSSVSEQKW